MNCNNCYYCNNHDYPYNYNCFHWNYYNFNYFSPPRTFVLSRVVLKFPYKAVRQNHLWRSDGRVLEFG